MRSIALIVACGVLFGLGSLILFFKEQRFPLFSLDKLTASTSNTYLGPNHPPKPGERIVQVQIYVRDSQKQGGVQIMSAEFDGKRIPLQPRDIYGNRGSASFQVSPGKYKLRWKVNRDQFNWPRSLSHEEKVEISPRDLWLQITIDGNDVSIR